MIRHLTVSCTQCKQVTDLFLSNLAPVIIFDCPACASPLLYYNHRVHTLSDRQLDEVRNGDSLRVIRKIVQSEDLWFPQQFCAPNSGAHDAVGDSRQSSFLLPAHKPEPVGRRVITRDEITDLRIALATARDVREFIAHIG